MIAEDKKKHFVYSASATLLVGLINPIYGVCFGAGLGLGKEFGDSKALGNRWSWGDILADALGVAFGAVCSWSISYFCLFTN